MEKNYFQQRNLNFKDKILSLDFQLIFLVLLLGIISFFAMYSTEQGKFGYFTQSHIYRFFIFFTHPLYIKYFELTEIYHLVWIEAHHYNIYLY